jgi:endonuclease/exonuclease/phosphatase family metal-dependent hydrolase
MRLITFLVALAIGTGLAGAEPLTVMSFNIRYGTAEDGDDAWPHRHDLVVATIAAAAPDLLGTQECLAFQRDELSAALPAYAVIAVGRDDGGEAGEMCASFYRRDRFDLLDHGTFWLSETPGVVASRGWDAALPRIATWLRLNDRRTGRELLWLNTHFDHRGAAARLESLVLLHRWLRRHQDDAALIVTGDFNLPADPSPGSDQQRLLGSILVDTWTAIHGSVEPVTGTFNGFDRHPRPGRIDWVLASPDLPVTRAWIDRTRHDGAWPSDHHPVLAILELE